MDAKQTKEFILAGHAVFTVAVSPQIKQAKAAEGLELADHYTFQVRHKAAEGQWKECWFLAMLTGPDNTKDYSYVGILTPATGDVRLTAKSSLQEGSAPVRLARYVLGHILGRGDFPAGLVIHHMDRCGRCGRALTTPESVQRGIGPECYKLTATAVDQALDRHLNPPKRRIAAQVAPQAPQQAPQGPRTVAVDLGRFSFRDGSYSAEASDLGLQGWPTTLVIVDGGGAYVATRGEARMDASGEELGAYPYAAGDLVFLVFND